MPLLTVLAPGTKVSVKGMNLPRAEVTAVRIRAGVNPVAYDVTWTDGTMNRTARYNALAVEALEEQQTPQSGRLSDLGAMFAGSGAGTNEPQGTD